MRTQQQFTESEILLFDRNVRPGHQLVVMPVPRARQVGVRKIQAFMQKRLRISSSHELVSLVCCPLASSRGLAGSPAGK